MSDEKMTNDMPEVDQTAIDQLNRDIESGVLQKELMAAWNTVDQGKSLDGCVMAGVFLAAYAYIKTRADTPTSEGRKAALLDEMQNFCVEAHDAYKKIHGEHATFHDGTCQALRECIVRTKELRAALQQPDNKDAEIARLKGLLKEWQFLCEAKNKVIQPDTSEAVRVLVETIMAVRKGVVDIKVTENPATLAYEGACKIVTGLDMTLKHPAVIAAMKGADDAL